MITWKISDGDIEFDGVGRPLEVSGKDLLSQLVKEVLLLETDSRGFGGSLGKTGFDVSIEIHEAVSRWLKLQKKSRYIRSSEEQIQGILFLNIVERTGTMVRFSLGIVSKSGYEQRLEMEVAV